MAADRHTVRVGRVVSGGQTGADRAALDAAAELGLPHGGWCPRGGWAEDLPHPPGLLARYPLMRETPGTGARRRTLWNVRDSDATLILAPDRLARRSPGTELTVQAAAALGRPLRIVDPHGAGAGAAVRALLARMPCGATLNVAGPRESEAPGLYASSRALLGRALRG